MLPRQRVSLQQVLEGWLAGALAFEKHWAALQAALYLFLGAVYSVPNGPRAGSDQDEDVPQMLVYLHQHLLGGYVWLQLLSSISPWHVSPDLSRKPTPRLTAIKSLRG